jgi:predicted nucleic acid-binding protein
MTLALPLSEVGPCPCWKISVKHQRSPVISTQVLQELYNTLTKKLHDSATVAKDKILRLAGMETVIVTPAIILAATDLHASASISFWDALIVAAAQSAGCDEIWSEDMQDGRSFGNVKIRNPFAGIS